MKPIKIITEAEATPEIQSQPAQNPSIRKTVRAVVFNERGEVALVHVGRFNYYTLPGGGIDPNEAPLQSIHRECLEEVGCHIAVSRNLGEIVEQQHLLNRIQISRCYLAQKIGKEARISLTQAEIEDGFGFIWANIDQAIHFVTTSQTIDYKGRFVKIRDSVFLQKAKRYL